MSVISNFIAALFIIALVSRIALLIFWLGSRAARLLKRKETSSIAMVVWANGLSLIATTFLIGSLMAWDGPPIFFVEAFVGLVGPAIVVFLADLAWIRWKGRGSS